MPQHPAPEALVRYRRLRGDLLRKTHRHRRATTPAGFATDIHQMHLDVFQRQLGALRQAWRRTNNATRWTARARARPQRTLPTD